MASRRIRLAQRRRAAGFSQESFAEAVGVDRSTVVRWEAGETEPQPWLRPKLAKILDISRTELDELLEPVSASVSVALPAIDRCVQHAGNTAADGNDADEQAALELARRVAASDVGDETLTRLEWAVDDLAIKYSMTPPSELIDRLRQHLSYVTHLLDARITLEEHRRLLVVGGWFSLLAATVHIDLKQQDAATARLKTAASLARHANHDEIYAWCFETEAWRVLTDGEYPRAVELARAAQQLAPKGSSIAVQAVAQEGRAWARLGQPKETYNVIDQVQRLVSSMPRPDRPEHHYRYDPDKSVAYIATTLAWLGDPAAEAYARDIITRLKPSEEAGKWPRRVAAANLDLALALLITDRLDEVCNAAESAMLSGRVVPSNHWRALEVVKAVEARQLPEATGLREVYEGMRRG